MTASAINAQLAAVHILVTGEASRGQAEIRARKVADFDRLTFRTRDMTRIVTPGTLQPCMLACERIA